MNEFISVLDMTDGAPYGARQRVTDEIIAMEQSIKKRMDAGLTPDEMLPARKVYAASQAARVILDSIFA